MSKEVAGLLYDPQRTYFEKSKEDGLIRGYDIHTGDCVVVLGDKGHVERTPSELVEITREDGTKVLAQKHIPLDEKSLAIRGGKLTPILRDVICSRIANGESLKKISEEADMPSYATFQKWLREDEDFAKALDHARQSRAEYYAERALEEAESATPSVAGVAKSKLIVETLWKSAEHDKPQKYSPKAANIKIDAPGSTFIIDTGIRRPGDPGYNVDETAKIREREVSQIETAREDEKGDSNAKLQVPEVQKEPRKQ